MKRLLQQMLILAFILAISSAAVLADFEESKIKKELPLLLGSSNQGTEFVMTFHPCWEQSGASNELKIYVASAVSTIVTLEIPALQIIRQVTTSPNEVYEFGLSPTTGQMYSKDDSEEPQPQQVFKGRACIITAKDPIVCYGVTRYQYTSDGYLAIPVSGLGKTYLVSSWNDPGQDTGGQYLTSYTSIVAAYDKTTVEFILGGERSNYTPGANSLKLGDKAKNKMNRGDVWLIGVNGDYNDLSGSYVEANKPVAVISGSFCAYVPIQNSACDFVIEQDLPMDTWGKKYHVTVIVDRKYASFIRVYASKPNTYLYRDGDEWAKITTVGGEVNKGYLSRRAILQGDKVVPITLSADNRISVTQYNCGQSEDGVPSDPFQMVLTPMEQYQKAIIFCTPGVRGGAPFMRNYLNFCYQSTENGFIPDDMEFGIGINGSMSWQKLNVKVTNPGEVFNDPEVTDGREWKAVTIKLDDPSATYAIRGDTKFAAYGYGFGNYDSYGWPVAVATADLSKPDVWPPTLEYTTNCFGEVVGRVFEEPRDVDSLRSNLATVKIVSSDSYNYIFDFEADDFFPGETNILDWTLEVDDELSDAKATLLFTDRAGNETVEVIEYQPPVFNISPRIVNWGQAAYNDPATTRELTLTNDSKKAIVVDSIMILSKDASRTWEENGFSLDPAVYTDGILPLEMQPGDELKFDVIFDPAVVKDDIMNGKNSFLDSVGIKAYWSDDVMDYCYYHYHSAIKSTTGTPTIEVGEIDFGQITVNSTSDEEVREVKNNGSSTLTITGTTGPADVVVYSVVRCGTQNTGDPKFEEISPTTPLTIEAGESKKIGVKFTPTATGQFVDQIEFISDADTSYAGHDPILELVGVGIQPGIIVKGFDWEHRRTHLPVYDETGNPYGNSDFPYTTDVAGSGENRLYIENTGDQSFVITEAYIDDARSSNPEYFTLSDANDITKTYTLEQGLFELVKGRTMDIATNKTRIFPVRYNPLTEGVHKATVVIKGEIDGFEIVGECVFEGESWYPKGGTADYFFTEYSVDSTMAHGYADTHYPPAGTAIVHDTNVPYYEMDIVFNASDWGVFADPVTIYGVNLGAGISGDIATPGATLFAVDKAGLDAAIGTGIQVNPGETFTFKARYYPEENSGPNADGLEDFMSNITFVTDADQTEHVSNWRARSITQNATTTNGDIQTCVQYAAATQISITNTGKDELTVYDITWTDAQAQYLNNDINRFSIDKTVFPVTLAPGATQTITVNFEQATPDQIASGYTQTFLFHTNILESNSDVTFPGDLEATVHTEVTSYPRETFAKVDGTNYKEGDKKKITFESGGSKFNYEVYIGQYDNDMQYITKKTDFDIAIVYDNNFFGPATTGNAANNNFRIDSKLGKGLNADDYEITISQEEKLTLTELETYKDTQFDFYTEINKLLTVYDVLPENLTRINIHIDNKSGIPINSQDVIEMVTLQFQVALNADLLNATNPASHIVHNVTTNEPCLGLEYTYDPYFELKDVCAQNLRLVEINQDANGNLATFSLKDIYPNPVDANGALIKFSTAFECNTNITIYDESGNAVATPVNGVLEFGNHAVPVPVEALSSGAYFIKMQAGPFSGTTKLVIVK